MSSFIKYFLVFALLAFATYSFTGCSKSLGSNYSYACSTPIGQIMIGPETDNNISLVDGVLHASREGKSIAIPFSQCVGLKDGRQ